MNIGLIYIILLCILNSILFFENSLGVNVIIFTIPLLIYLFYIFKINKLIKNKWGLLLFIPIVLLSLHYLFFNNVLDELNVLAIIGLYGLLYVFTMKPTSNFGVLVDQFVRVLLMPLECIEPLLKNILNRLSEVLKLSDKKKRIIKSTIIVIPVVLVVLLLLMSADSIFSSLFSGFFELFDNVSLPGIINRLFVMMLLFIYMSLSMYYVVNRFSDCKNVNVKFINIDEYTIKLLLTILNIIYIVFDIIQIRSLLLHRVSTNVVYAEYARSGFFQLMFISFINITIILLSNNKKNKYSKNMSLGMILLTLIIIISSAYRMYMYESQYGYTVLRLGVYAILFSEVILFIPTIMYIIKDKFDILKYYMIICICIYTIINFVPVDYIIARRNVNRYYKTDKIDIYYLEDYRYENVGVLKELYSKTEDKEIKDNLDRYFKELLLRDDNIFEYNVWRDNSFKILK